VPWFWRLRNCVKGSYSDRKRALKWVLPTRLRRYGLRPSGKTKGSTKNR
jgi:hypothetical protein